MSKIIVRKLESPTGNLSFQGGLTISDTTSISYPGRIVQMKHKMIHTRTSWSNPGSDTGSVSNNVPNMNMDFQCKFSDSLVILEARVMGDVHHNTIFRYTVNGNKITTAKFYSEHILPRSYAHAKAAAAKSDLVMGLKEDQF